jgi:CRP-like cAMP-binding protein
VAAAVAAGEAALSGRPQAVKVKSMAGKDIHEALRQIDFFSDYSSAELDELLEVGQWIKYPSGRAIITEEDTQLDLFVLVRGQVKVVKNGKVLATLHPGDSFGEITALTRTPRTAHVIAKGECYCVRFEAINLHRLSTELQLKLVKKLLFTLADRLAALNRKFCVT